MRVEHNLLRVSVGWRCSQKMNNTTIYKLTDIIVLGHSQYVSIDYADEG